MTPATTYSPELTHYTRTVEAVTGILTNGFAWVPNRRGLISELVPSHPFDEREPQQFGMISFSELKPNESDAHRRCFGEFGVTVSAIWAERHMAQRVIYIDRKGPLFEALSRIFQTGYARCDAGIDYPDDDGLRMAFTNKAMATVVGAPLWADLLQIYEYIEPIEHSVHREWRIVNPRPLYGLPTSKSEVIRNVSPPKGWAIHLNVVRVEPGDVLRIICPASSREHLEACLPSAYSAVPVQCFDS